ncbi:MAG: hypothetical protein AB1791_23455, partial [Chloroflexota bacterium]
MRRLVYPLMVLSAAGFVASLVVHGAAWLGIEWTWCFFPLHMGIFVVGVPAALMTGEPDPPAGGRTFWKHAFRGAPTWMRVMTVVFILYAVVNLTWGMVAAVLWSRGLLETPPAFGRLFSGHWMAVYAAAWSTFYA